VLPHYRIILGRDRIHWWPYAGYLSLRFKAVRYAMSEDSPKWARTAAHRYSRLRYKTVRLAQSEKAPRWIRKAYEWWSGRA
jgi:hypothetical protein